MMAGFRNQVVNNNFGWRVIYLEHHRRNQIGYSAYS